MQGTHTHTRHTHTRVSYSEGYFLIKKRIFWGGNNILIVSKIIMRQIGKTIPIDMKLFDKPPPLPLCAQWMKAKALIMTTEAFHSFSRKNMARKSTEHLTNQQYMHVYITVRYCKDRISFQSSSISQDLIHRTPKQAFFGGSSWGIGEEQR